MKKCQKLQIWITKHFTFIKDRPFNDKVYKISVSKLRKLGWTENKVFDKSYVN